MIDTATPQTEAVRTAPDLDRIDAPLRAAGPAREFGMTVIALIRRPDTLLPDMAAVGFGDLLAQSDVLLVCCPLTGTTRGLIHVARGHLRGVELGMFDTQPQPADHPPFALPNVMPNVMPTPHVAVITEDSRLLPGQGTADEVQRLLNDHLPLNFRNPEVEPPNSARFPAPLASVGLDHPRRQPRSLPRRQDRRRVLTRPV